MEKTLRINGLDFTYSVIRQRSLRDQLHITDPSVVCKLPDQHDIGNKGQIHAGPFGSIHHIEKQFLECFQAPLACALQLQSGQAGADAACCVLHFQIGIAQAAGVGHEPVLCVLYGQLEGGFVDAVGEAAGRDEGFGAGGEAGSLSQGTAFGCQAEDIGVVANGQASMHARSF